MSDVQLTVVEGDVAQVIGAIPGPQGPAGAVAAAIDGSAALPSIAFASDTDTGLYRVGANQLGVSTGGTQRLVIDETGQIEATSLGTAAAPTWTFVGDPDTGAYSPGANQFAISTGGTGRLFVDASGNIATGVATYSKPLTINNANAAIALRANSGGTYSDHGIFFAVDGANYSQIYNDGAGQLIFRTGSALNERLRITSTGNVGIGTASPVTPLEVSSASNTQIRAVTTDATGASIAGLLLDQTGTGASTFIVRAGSNYSILGTTTNTPVLFTVNNVERARFDSSGRLGIGTASPGFALDVQSGDLRIKRSASDDAALYFGNSTNNYIFGSNTNNLFAFATNGSERARIRSDGMFEVKGAGTAGASPAFSVSGSAPANSAIVDSSGRLLLGTSTNTGGSLFQVNDNRIRIATAKTPASATDTGSAGEICWDANYIYVCTATNTWKRTAISTW